MTGQDATVPSRCPTCDVQHPDEWHVARCAYEVQAVQRVAEAAALAGVAEVAARDLFAHLRTIGNDIEWARQHTITVLGLGWRPIFVSHGAWTPPPASTAGSS